MKEPKYKSVVIVPHSKECFYNGTNINPWSGLPDSEFWGNYRAIANHKHSNHLWIRVKCNCSTCPAIKAVHSYVLVNA